MKKLLLFIFISFAFQSCYWFDCSYACCDKSYITLDVDASELDQLPSYVYVDNLDLTISFTDIDVKYNTINYDNRSEVIDGCLYIKPRPQSYGIRIAPGTNTWHIETVVIDDGIIYDNNSCKDNGINIRTNNGLYIRKFTITLYKIYNTYY
jgi:hypothetical protein